MKTVLGSMALLMLIAVSTVASASNGSRMFCTKAGVVVESCCCVESDGAMVCSLTGETVADCCCR